MKQLKMALGACLLAFNLNINPASAAVTGTIDVYKWSWYGKTDPSLHNALYEHWESWASDGSLPTYQKQHTRYDAFATGDMCGNSGEDDVQWDGWPSWSSLLMSEGQWCNGTVASSFTNVLDAHLPQWYYTLDGYHADYTGVWDATYLAWKTRNCDGRLRVKVTGGSGLYSVNLHYNVYVLSDIPGDNGIFELGKSDARFLSYAPANFSTQDWRLGATRISSAGQVRTYCQSGGWVDIHPTCTATQGKHFWYEASVVSVEVK
jgi:hypothetical protein